MFDVHRSDLACVRLKGLENEITCRKYHFEWETHTNPLVSKESYLYSQSEHISTVEHLCVFFTDFPEEVYVQKVNISRIRYIETKRQAIWSLAFAWINPLQCLEIARDCVIYQLVKCKAYTNNQKGLFSYFATHFVHCRQRTWNPCNIRCNVTGVALARCRWFFSHFVSILSKPYLPCGFEVIRLS